jgi:hypothetical protein
MLFGCFFGKASAVAEGGGSDSGSESKTKKAVQRMRSATARLRSLSLDDLSRTLASSGLHAFTLAELKAATRGFSCSHFVGEGGFGPVYKGFLDDRLRPGEIEPQHVAVKYLSTPTGRRDTASGWYAHGFALSFGGLLLVSVKYAN